MDKFINQEATIDANEPIAISMQESINVDKEEESSKELPVNDTVKEEVKSPELEAKENVDKSNKKTSQKPKAKAAKKLKENNANIVQDPKALKISKLRREMYADAQPGLYGG